MRPTTSEATVPSWPRYGATAAAAAAIAALLAFDPERVRLVPPCPVRALTGLDCPGCGSGRCVYDLVHGDVVAAIDHNPLTVALAPVMLVALVVWWAPSLRQPWMTRAVSSRWTMWGSLALMVAFTVVRNTPTALGRYLASG